MIQRVLRCAGVAAIGWLWVFTATGASADLPDVLDRVPADARAIVVIPSVDALDEASAQLLVAMEQPEASTLKQLLRVVGVAGAIDTKRPVAAFWSGGGAGSAPVLAMLVPTSNAARAMESLKAVKGHDEVWEFSAGERAWFARAINENDLIVTIDPKSAEFEPNAGQMEAHRNALGGAAIAAAEGSHAFIVASMDEFRPMIHQWLNHGEALVEALGADAAMLPGAADLVRVTRTIADGVVRDSERAVVAMRFDGAGTTLEIVSLFKPGSAMDKASRAGGGADGARMFGALPGLPFLLAVGIDASHAGVRDLAADALHAGGEQGGGPRTALDAVSAIDAAVYEPGMGGAGGGGPMVVQGAMSKVLIHWRAEEPSAFKSWFREHLGAIDAAGSASGVKATYDEGTGEMSGLTVDRWMIALPSTQDRRTALLYGQNGTPRGIVAVREQDGFISSAPDDLMVNVLGGRAAGSLADNAMVRDLWGKLPADSVARVYFNFRPILMQAMPVLAMMGINIDIPLRVPPIAGGVALDDGHARAGVFVPAYAIKLGIRARELLRAMESPDATGTAR